MFLISIGVKNFKLQNWIGKPNYIGVYEEWQSWLEIFYAKNQMRKKNQKECFAKSKPSHICTYSTINETFPVSTSTSIDETIAIRSWCSAEKFASGMDENNWH